MRKVLFATAALLGMATLATSHASAAPSAGLAGVTAAPAHNLLTNVDYYWQHRHWHHRRWNHGHWRYWD